MAKIRICDRCRQGENLQIIDGGVGEVIYPAGSIWIFHWNQSVDLCSPCLKEFLKFIV